MFALIPIMPRRVPLFHAIECKKGRGIILPGGKWEKGETFMETGIREAKEEMGLDLTRPRLFHFGANSDGYLCYTFEYDLVRPFQVPTETDEGRPCEATFADMMASDFWPYFQILEQIWRYRG